MPDVSFGNLVAVSAIAFLAPLLLGFLPRVRIPSVVVEIVAGIVVGPSVLGWVRADLPVQVLALLGLAFLLFVAGLEVEFERLRGRLLGIAGAGFALTFVLAVAVAIILWAAGLVDTPLLVAVILSATSLGVVVPVLKDSGEAGSQFGQLVIASSSLADFGAVVLLTLLFSREATGTGAKLLLLGGTVVLAAVVGLALSRAGRVMRISAVIQRLQDTTAQIRVRGAVLLLVGFVAVAERLGLETILGAFLAGAVLSIVDRDRMMTHEHFRLKIEALSFGFLVPVFFVSSGLRFDLGALFARPSTVLQVPLFLLALLVVRGIPAILYRGVVGPRRTAAAALLQATSLAFIVAATQIGMELGLLSKATGAAMVAAGLLSVLVFPAAALSVLGSGPQPTEGNEEPAGLPEETAFPSG
jgi:Kef-type K+ transport system membrane component KefB